MKKIRTIKQATIAGIFLITASTFLAGCGITDQIGQKIGEKIVEKTIESGTGGKVNIDTSNGGLDIKTDQGALSVSGGGSAKLPSNLPSDIYMYDDAKIMLSLSGSSENKGYSVSYSTGTTPADVFSKYKETMASKGWTKENEMDLGSDNGMVLNFKKGAEQVMVNMGHDKESGKTMVSITGGPIDNNVNANETTGQPIQE